MSDIDDDFIYNALKELVIREQAASISFLQRRAQVGYTRAARYMERLESEGIVGPFTGTNTRAVLVKNGQENK